MGPFWNHLRNLLLGVPTAYVYVGKLFNYLKVCTLHTLLPYLDSIFFHLVGKVKDDSHPDKWKWTVVKQSGSRPSPRSGLSLAVVPGNRAFCFGGVYDEVSQCFTLILMYFQLCCEKICLKDNDLNAFGSNGKEGYLWPCHFFQDLDLIVQWLSLYCVLSA